MPFNSKKFLMAKHQHSTEDVPVDDLAAFFDLKEDEKPVWVVRNLEGIELGVCNEVAAKNKNLGAIVEGLAGSLKKDKVQAIKEMLGDSSKAPDDIAKRLAMLVAGSVKPKCDMELAALLCKTHPIEFYHITNVITKLTGVGAQVGKRKPSGKSQR